MKELRYIHYFLLCAVAVLLSACGNEEDEPNNIPPDAVYDIMTLESTSDKGSVFTMQVSDDSELISYDAPYDFTKSENLKPGRRVLICYKRIDGPTYTSGRITVYGYATLSNTEQNVIVGSADEYDNWLMMPMQVSALWRTGPYINLQTSIYVTVAERPKVFVLVADQSTIDDEIPQMYLIYKNLDSNDGENLYDVKASFDIREIWDRTTCKGIRVHYNQGEAEFFKK